MKVVTAEEMRRIDRIAIEERGAVGDELMEAAGAAIARAVMDHIEPGLVVILAGAGNNAGDGFVVARRLVECGYPCVVVPVLGADNFRGDAALAWGRIPRERVQIRQLPVDDAELLRLFRDADALVDAMLGTGARLPLKEAVDRVVRIANASGTPIIAADIPTGLDANGELQSDDAPIIRAALTVTIGLPKVGMLGPRGIACCGHVRVEAIQFPRDLLEHGELTRATLTMDEAARLLPVRPASGHKGTFGTVLVCAGSRFMPGAAVLAATGALRSGAGLVRLHAPEPVIQAASYQLPELLLSADSAWLTDHLAPIGSADFARLTENVDALVIGPGVGQHVDTEAFLKHVLTHFNGPIVVDADAVNLVAKSVDLRSRLDGRVVLTPHPGEMARLLGVNIPTVQADRWGAVRQGADLLRATVVLKGYGPLIASAGMPETMHIPAGSTALSKGGSGDMLAGLIGGLLAQGLSSHRAAILGTFVGGLASDLLVRERSPRATLIRDVADLLPAAFRQLEDAQRAR